MPRQIKGSKVMITSTCIYTKLFVLFFHVFFVLDNGSFQYSCMYNCCWAFFLSVIYQTSQIHYYVYIGFNHVNVHEQFFFKFSHKGSYLLAYNCVCNYLYKISYCVPNNGVIHKIMLHLRTSLLPNNVIFFIGCCEIDA